jgi:hypothetical protein
MKELVRTNDPVMLSWLEATLRGVGIEPLVLDRHMSAVEGSLGILPRRVLVEEGDYALAKALLDKGPEPLEPGDAGG